MTAAEITSRQVTRVRMLLGATGNEVSDALIIELLHDNYPTQVAEFIVGRAFCAEFGNRIDGGAEQSL